MTWEFSHTKNGEPQYDCIAESSWDSETFARYVEHCEKIGYFEHWKHEDGSQMTPEEVYEEIMKIHIPAWSLHRLLLLLPKEIRIERNFYTIAVVNDSIQIVDDCGDIYRYFMSMNVYGELIDCIEWLIKEGYFPKEYLV